jgi:glycosyltransferase involved in cell wall biosynthesis
MKILHVIDHFSLGGAQRIVEGILNTFPDAVLLPLRKKGGPGEEICVPDHQVLLKPRRHLLLQIVRLLQVPRLIRQYKFKIVHCHLPASWLFGLWIHLMLPARSRPQLIFHEHDSIKLERWYYPLLIRTASRAGTILAVSKYIQDQITSHGIALEDIQLLHNFVDLNRFSPGKTPALNHLRLESEQVQSYRLVGFAGRLIGYKGWEYIVRAASRLHERNIRFLIAGEGPDAGKLKNLVEQMNLKDSVILLGYVHRMVDFYRLIDVLVIASERESFGLVQIEAQACGVPVILFESQAALELHGMQSTIIVPYGDTDALVANIESLFEDSQAYQRLVEKGLENARQYDLPSFTQKLTTIYAALMGKKDY